MQISGLLAVGWGAIGWMSVGDRSMVATGRWKVRGWSVVGWAFVWRRLGMGSGFFAGRLVVGSQLGSKGQLTID